MLSSPAAERASAGRGIAHGFAREGMKLALAGLEHAPSADNQYESGHIGGYSAAVAVADEIGGDAFAIDGDVADAVAGEYLFECFMASVSQGLEPPGNPGQFKET